jgi:hypothetical protein
MNIRHTANISDIGSLVVSLPFTIELLKICVPRNIEFNTPVLEY